MDLSEKVIGVLLVLGAALVVGLLVWAIQDMNGKSASCEARGGVYLKGGTGYVCVKMTLIPEDSEKP